MFQATCSAFQPPWVPSVTLRCKRAQTGALVLGKATSQKAVQLPGWLGEPGTCRGWMNGSTDVRAAGTKVTAGEACPAPGERGLRPREERRGRSTAASENGDSLRRVTSARASAPRVHARRASCDLTLSCSAPGCEVGVLHARGSEAQELQDDAGHPKGASKAVGTRPQHARPDSDTVTQ